MLLVINTKSPPEGDGGFAGGAVVSLHCLWVYLEKSYWKALDFVEAMRSV
jgi:hypothetical protein